MKIKNISFIFIFFIISLILIEVFSYTFLLGYSKFQVLQGAKNYNLILNEIKSPINHPIFKKNLQNKFLETKLVAFDTISDPYLTYRLTPNEKRSNIAIDKYGVVHNGEPTNLKKKYSKKIIMFGGSTVEGSTGAPNNTCTLPSFLERYLNLLFSDETIQVINAGTGGSYSPRQLVQFNIEYVHLKPDLIISFEGFNDFWHYYPPSKDSGDWGKFSIPNRSRVQIGNLKVRNKDLQFKNLVQNYPKMTRYFWNTIYLMTLIVNKFSRKDENKNFFDPKLNKDPWPHIAKHIMEDINKSYSHAPFFVNNWISLKGSANVHNIKSLFFLQPAYPRSNKKFTKTEIDLYNKFYIERPFLNKDDVEKKFNVFYNDVLKLLYNFNSEDFIDFSKIFDGNNKTIYLDIVHYLHTGNSIIAKKMLPYVVKKLKLPERNFANLKTLSCKY